MGRRLVVVISSIEPGGAEGVAVRLCNAWAQAGSAITLVTLLDKPVQLALHPAIEHLYVATASSPLSRRSGPLALWSRVAALRTIIKTRSPDVIISHMDQTNIQVVIAGVGLHRPLVVVDHVDPRVHPLPAKWRLLRRLTYPLATRLVTVCSAMLEAYPSAVRSRAQHIPNPVVAPELADQAAHGGKAIVAMGRLIHQKGFDVLIRAFATVAQRHREATLTIWGAGPEQERLRALAEGLKIGSSVRLAGFTREPFEALLRGSVFVLPSRYEGFGLALAEAMALGMPVVATDCLSGPNEIVRHGMDGLLVPPENTDRLADALCAVLDDPDLARRLAHNARDVRERYSLARVLAEWECLFETIRPSLPESHS